jgi:hypothetical protein
VSAPTLPPITNFSFWFMVFVFWLIAQNKCHYRNQAISALLSSYD